jgi:hypothetical protein
VTKAATRYFGKISWWTAGTGDWGTITPDADSGLDPIRCRGACFRSADRTNLIGKGRLDEGEYSGDVISVGDSVEFSLGLDERGRLEARRVSLVTDT